MKQTLWKMGLIVVCMCALSLIFACAKPPTKEIADAEKAIADAKANEADLYVQDVFTKAQDEMKKAGEMVTAKKYDEAKTAAMEAAKMAQQSVTLIEQNKQKLKEELEAMLPNVQKALDEVKTLAATAIKKKAVASKDELQSAIGKLELDMTAVKEQLQAGKIRQAVDLAKSLIEQANAQKQTLTDAMAQLKPAKK
jgi:phage-related protein